MFDPDSRYYDIDEATIKLPDGRQVVYKRRRIIRRSRSTLVRGQVQVRQDERVDHVATRTLGDPGQYWRLMDVNGVMNPRVVDESDATVLAIPVPGTESL